MASDLADQHHQAVHHVYHVHHLYVLLMLDAATSPHVRSGTCNTMISCQTDLNIRIVTSKG